MSLPIIPHIIHKKKNSISCSLCYGMLLLMTERKVKT